MKKIFFTAILLAAVKLVFPTCMAQDTISGAFIHENYFYREGIRFDSASLPKEILLGDDEGPNELFFRCITDDTLNVYGVAALLANPKEDGVCWWCVYDTAEASANAYLLLAVPSADSVVWVRQVEVNPFFTPTAYFIDLSGGATPPAGYVGNIYINRVVEQTFDSPYQVHDTFYVGKTIYGGIPVDIYDENGNWRGSIPKHMEGLLGSVYLPKDVYDSALYHFRYTLSTGQEVTRWYLWGHNHIRIMYPMLLPPDSTISDTTAINPAQFVDRMVGISPNPTSGRVKVVSNFGITKIEVHDLSGTLIATPLSKQDGSRHLSFTFNTDTWPTGTYVLRINTPMGVATKKLTVAR